MNADQSSYKVNADYKGQRNILVPTRMYSRNALLNAIHIKSDKYLGVNLDRYALTFHSDKDSSNKNPEHEIAFSHIKSLEADVTKADSGKYYLKVHTDEGDLKFKFNNARDFHNIVEALRNTIHNDKPFYNASESYNSEAKKFSDRPMVERKDKLNDSISSDDMKDYQNVDKKNMNIGRDAAQGSYIANKDAINSNSNNLGDNRRADADFDKNRFDAAKDFNRDMKKDNLDLQKDNYRMNRDVIADNRYDAGLDKNLNKDQFKANKDNIKNEFKAQKDIIDQDYKEEKGFDKDLAKDRYKSNKDSIKDQREVNLAYNKDQFKENKDNIKISEKADKNRVDYAQDRNEAEYDYAKKNIKSDAERAKDNFKADQDLYKDGDKVDKEIAKNQMKGDFREGKADLKSDVRDAKDIKDRRY